MPTKVKAVYEGGVFRPLEPFDFTEQTPVELTIEPLPQRSVVDETHGLIHVDPKTARMIAKIPFLPYGVRQRAPEYPYR